MNKLARALRDEYGVPYSAALRLIREVGVEKATEQCEAWKKKAAQLNAAGRELAELEVKDG